MPERRFTMVGLGEVLWDLLPGGPQLGGAPANFAYHAARLGDRGVVASRVGDDALGQATLERLAALGLSVEAIQRDPDRPTGTVAVAMDARGQATYTFPDNVAWDALDWTPAWAALASQADAVCFGTLGQRAARARETIGRFLRATRPTTARVFDVNLRQSFYSATILDQSLALATIVKLNDEELPIVAELLGLGGAEPVAQARALLARHPLTMVCVTRGSAGSLVVTPTAVDEHPGLSVTVVDTVGAGDAFTAALAHHALRGTPLPRLHEAANQLGAWVAARAGATPTE